LAAARPGMPLATFLWASERAYSAMHFGRRGGFLTLPPSDRSARELVTTCHDMVQELGEGVADFIFGPTGPTMQKIRRAT